MKLFLGLALTDEVDAYFEATDFPSSEHPLSEAVDAVLGVYHLSALHTGLWQSFIYEGLSEAKYMVLPITVELVRWSLLDET